MPIKASNFFCVFLKFAKKCVCTVKKKPVTYLCVSENSEEMFRRVIVTSFLHVQRNSNTQQIPAP